MEIEIEGKIICEHCGHHITGHIQSDKFYEYKAIIYDILKELITIHNKKEHPYDDLNYSKYFSSRRKTVKKSAE